MRRAQASRPGSARGAPVRRMRTAARQGPRRGGGTLPAGVDGALR